MKSLSEYIQESLYGKLNLRASISYPIFQDIYLYLDNHTELLERLQAICDTFRKKYNENLTEETLLNSKIYEKFIDDVINKYKEDVRTVEINFATKKHLMQELACKAVTKIRLEQDLPKIEEEDI